MKWLGRWFLRWHSAVDVGLRPKNVFEGYEVNLYPFTQRGNDWIASHIEMFNDAKWSEREHCLLLSTADSSWPRLMSIIAIFRIDEINWQFYGRLRGKDKKTLSDDWT